MPRKVETVKTIEGERVKVTETDYSSVPAMFGLVVGLLGGPLLSFAAGAVTYASMFISRTVKYNRLEKQKNAVTDENALEALHPHIRHLPDSALLPCIRAMTRDQMLSLQDNLDEKTFRELTSRPGIGPKRWTFQLEYDLKEAKNEQAFIKEHAEQLFDFNPASYPLPEEAKVEIPKLEGLDDAKLKELIIKERAKPNAALRQKLKDAVRERVSAANIEGWKSFLSELSEKIEYTVAEYSDSRDRCYGDLLDRLCLPKPADADEASEDELDEDAVRRLRLLRPFSNLIEGILRYDGIIDLSEESPEIQKGLRYLEENILNTDRIFFPSIDQWSERHYLAVKRMLADPEAPVKQVIAACEKYQLYNVLELIEEQLALKIQTTRDYSKSMRWLACMPNSSRLIHQVSQRFKIQSYTSLRRSLAACKSDLEYSVLKDALRNNYSRDTILDLLQGLDKRVRKSPIKKPNLAAMETHDERMWAVWQYEIRSGREIRDFLHNRLARDLRENELLGKDADWFKQVWAYAEQQNDQALKAACVDALARAKDASFHDKLPDLWDGRFPPTLYSGWRRNPIHE